MDGVVPEEIRTLADALPFWSRENPSHTALMELNGDDELDRITFHELAEQVDAFAAHLRRRGVGPGRTVALLMPNSARWIVAYWSVFRLGAVAAPLEYAVLDTEPERIEFALANCDAHVVVCEPEDARRVAELTSAGIVSARAEPRGTPPSQPEVEPDDLAQILYTSGATGPKKGVELTHRNLISNVRACCKRMDVRRDDCLPALLPYHHAYPLTTTIILPACAGVPNAVGDVRTQRSKTLLRKCRPTVFVGVPRVFDAMLDGIRRAAQRAGRGGQLRRARWTCAALKKLLGLNTGKLLLRRLHAELFGGRQLRFCMSGGARISPRTLREFFLLGIPVLQGWGMSEISPVGTAQAFSPLRFYLTRHYERKAGSIGKPLDGATITFTRSSVEDLSFDLEQWGEMLVSGPHVMRGYHNDPESTARLMVGGAIRTGDIARRDEDGDLYIVGRVKHVIVLPSGKKVFPEEQLDEPLRRCRTIQEAAVRPIRDAQDREQIGLALRPNLAEVREAKTLGELYSTIKRDIDAALEGGPAYLKRYDFCLSAWRGGEYEELIKTGMGDPSPLRNPFTRETAYSSLKGSDEPVPWRQNQA